MTSKFMRAALGLALLASPAVAQTTQPATQPAAQPATKPATQPFVMPEITIPDDLTGVQLAVQAQQAFNRGEYARALPMLRRLASENEHLPAKLASIRDRIRICEKALDAARREMESKGLDAQAGLLDRPDVSAEARKPHPSIAAGQVYDTDIQNLGNFEYDQERGGNIPDDVLKLTGARVRVKGYMIPMDQAENITQFALVPSLFACCFGQPPQIQHTIVANTPQGKAVGYTADEIVVEGTLKVKEKKDDGYIISLFELEVNSVKVAPRG